jgi:hypothetical protein
MSAAHLLILRLNIDWHDHFRFAPRQKLRFQHAHNRVRRLIQMNHPPNHARIAAKILFPRFMRQRRHRSRSLGVISIDKQPPNKRPRPQNPQPARRQAYAANPFRLTGASQVHVHWIDQRNVLEHRALPFPIHKCSRRN